MPRLVLIRSPRLPAGHVAKRPLALVLAFAMATALATSTATAQTAPPSTPPPAPAPAPPAPAASAAQRVEITGGRNADTEERRQSTAAKIIIGREEIEKFGDATVGEVLRRLPGVTTPGAPGRGGPPRLRGLGGGYTQLLIDGQRIPPGFSLESLTPEQIERIEILRAPTAETGARAIAGTINIITREGFKRRLNDLRLGFGYENGQFTPGLFWTHNDSAGPLTYNLSAGLFRNWRDSASSTTTSSVDLVSGLSSARFETSTSHERRLGLNLTSRLQWRLSETGDLLMLMPTLFSNESSTERRFDLQQTGGVQPYDSGQSQSEGRFTNLRINGQWRKALGVGTRLELNTGVGAWRAANHSRREEFLASAGAGAGPVRIIDDQTRTRENSATLSAKLSSALGAKTDGSGEHSLVSGAEVDSQRRRESSLRVQTPPSPLPIDSDDGDDLEASSLRMAAYVQDEWALNPNWSFHAGLRWEGIRTRGDSAVNANNSLGVATENRSSVWTPLLHLLWKPDPKKRDQLRLSLTRSYRSPNLNSLIARPRYSSDPLTGPNAATRPDRLGNPALKPETAIGIDLAFERYLEGGGLLSANLFSRRISDLIRNELSDPQTVPWSPALRWVERPVNIGDAVTQGIEFEAKFRLDQALAGATPVELRANLSLFRSRVDGVPGPDNRLDSQAKATANFGADYRFRGAPLTLGGNLNWVPGYRTRLSEEKTASVSGKRVFDAFGLWTFNPATALRVLASNAAPQDYLSSSTVNTSTLRELAQTSAPTYTHWQLRLELKL